MKGMGGDSLRLLHGPGTQDHSPRRTKLKVSGGTQTKTNSTHQNTKLKHGDQPCRDIHPVQPPPRNFVDEHHGDPRQTNELPDQDFILNCSPQKCISGGGGMQLSDSTRERLMLSRSPGGPGVSKSRSRRISRDRPGLQNIKTYTTGYTSDSSECLYGEGQGQTQKPTEGTSWGNLPEGGSLGIAPDWGSWGIPPEGGSRGLPQGISRDQWQGKGATGVWQVQGQSLGVAGAAGGLRYSTSSWVQQHQQGRIQDAGYSGYNSLDNYYTNNKDRKRENMRAANSLESLDSVSSSIQTARALSNTKNVPDFSLHPASQQSSQHRRDQPSPQATRINRSSSVSTHTTSGTPEFQMTFPMRKPCEESEYYGVPVQAGRQALPLKKQRHYSGSGAMARNNTAPMLHNNSASMPRNNTTEMPHSASHSLDEGQTGSLGSIISAATSTKNIQDKDKVLSEIVRLKKDLRDEQSKVKRLNSQLSTNTHVVGAFEQSLCNMTNRLQQLTRSADEKDKELQDLHKTIESLRRQGAELGFGKLPGSCESLLYHQNHIRNGFHSATSDSENENENQTVSRKTFNFKNRKSKWLQQSISRAFSRSRKTSGSVSEAENSRRFVGLKTVVDSATSCPGSPIPRGHHRSKSAPVLDEGDSGGVEELRQQLLQKESALTETRLEALTSAHQLQSLRETINKLKSDLMTVRQENDRLQRERFQALAVATTPSTPISRRGTLSSTGSTRALLSDTNQSTGSNKQKKSKKFSNYSESPIRRPLCSPGGGSGEDRRGCSLLQTSCSLETDCEEVYVPVSVISLNRRPQGAQVKIGSVTISRNSSWIKLDECLRGLVKTYLGKLDPENSLELTNESMVCYQCGNIRRMLKTPVPEGGPSLLPDTRIWVSFRGGTDLGSLEELAFSTLMAKSVIKKYVATLAQYQRAVLVGHSGIGKTFLATRLADFLVLRAGDHYGIQSSMDQSSRIGDQSTRVVDQSTRVWDQSSRVGDQSTRAGDQSSRVGDTSTRVGDQSTSADDYQSTRVFDTSKASAQESSDFLSGLKLNMPGQHPTVVILENIESQGSKILQILSRLEMSSEALPFILCTSRPTEYIRDVSIRYGLAEIPLGEDVELIQGFLGRYLRQKLLSLEVTTGLVNFDMPEAIQWILRIYCNLYIFVKTTSKAKSCLSPSWFLACPVESTQCLRSWFIDFWNSTLVSYLRQVVGTRGQDPKEFEDPVRFVIRTWPWQDQLGGLPQALLKVKTEVRRAVPGQTEGQQEDDPLLSMLMCLQEAALYSEDSENMSSNTSIHKFSSDPDNIED